MATASKKSCGPQLDEENSEPNSDWPLSDLTDFARNENQAIQQNGELLAGSYWRLGHALTLARRHFARGQWGKYLEELGIDKTRSSKAMAIYRTFPCIDKLRGHSVESAYNERVRKKRANRVRDSESEDDSPPTNSEASEAATSGHGTLREFLSCMHAESEHWVHEAAFVEGAEAAEALILCTQALAALQEIHRSLQQQAETQ